MTGASSGIGLAAARALAAAGWRVVLTARRADRIGEAEEEIRSGGGQALAVPCDLEEPGAPAALVAQIVEALGRLDLLVNNAGWGYTAPADRVPESAARRIVALDLLSPFLLMSAALPHLRPRRGVVINIASGGGLLPAPYYALYSAAKSGLVSLTDSIRLEEEAAGSGVRLVALCPGPVRTEFAHAAGGAPVHADRMGVRVQSAEEIAALIVAHAERPGRTVPTTLPVRAGAWLHRAAPRLFGRMVLRWARKIRPDVLAGSQTGEGTGRG